MCWNITLLDDGTFDLRDRNTHKSLHTWVVLYTSKSIQSHYSTVFIVDDERGKKSKH